ncbi:hypothetical protein COO60DRAFT_1705536, partial [Scenedesmus sp. NREL 46B-D3]
MPSRAAPVLAQLLHNRGVLALCLLALIAQPGVAGPLFAGEAAGSVVTPFPVDWLLHNRRAAAMACQTAVIIVEFSSSSSSGKVNGRLKDAMLTLLVQARGGSSSSGSSSGTAAQLPSRFCPHTDAAAATAAAGGRFEAAAVAGTAASAPLSSPGSLSGGPHATRMAGVGAASQPRPRCGWRPEAAQCWGGSRLSSAALAPSAVTASPGCMAGKQSSWHRPAAAEARQLLVTGCVLALLGGCHSNCGALIVTVLTHLAAAAGGDRPNHQGGGDGGDGCGDSSEVVMVLHVLFWVLGITAGAAVAGLPGSGLQEQQLTGCV